MKEFIKNILSFRQPGKYNNEECIYINNYFVLVKDLKMKTDNIDNLHFTAWCKNTNIHSLKDLNHTYIPHLHEIEAQTKKIIKHRYNGFNNIDVFIHYPPQFCQLHIHFINRRLFKNSQNYEIFFLSDVVRFLSKHNCLYSPTCLNKFSKQIYLICTDINNANKIKYSNNIKIIPCINNDYDITYYNLICYADKNNFKNIVICDDRYSGSLNYNMIQKFINPYYDIYYHRQKEFGFTIYNKSSYNTIKNWNKVSDLTLHEFINQQDLVFKNNFQIITFYMNCHAEELIRYFKTIRHLNHCIIYHIITYELINKKKIYDEELENIKYIIKHSDIIIYNPVNIKHKFWYYENILSYKSKFCLTIKIPFTRFNGYWHDNEQFSHSWEHMFHYGLPGDILESFISKYPLTDINEFIKKMENNDNNTSEKIKIKIKKDLEYLKKLYQNSDIDMCDFVLHNYKKTQLFLNREHPNSLFFKVLTHKILHYIGLDYNNLLLFDNEQLDKYEMPILNCVKKSLQLEFDLKTHVKFHNYLISVNDYYKLFINCNYNSEYKYIRDVGSILVKLEIPFIQIKPDIIYDNKVIPIY
jgi:hypothetical protein